MKPNIIPLNNHALVEVIDDYAGLVRADDGNEQMQKGYLRHWNFTSQHLTESTGHAISYLEGGVDWTEILDPLTNKVVYWQQYADTGRVFEQDNKKYALIPWYRLIGYEETA